MTKTDPRDDSGYAMLAAVAGIAVFGFLGLQVITSSRAVVGETIARIEQAQLSATADAAIALAITHINTDRDKRWPFNGTPQKLNFGASDVVVRVVDENGKVPINQLDDVKLRRLFEAVGAKGERLDMLVDAYKDWRNGDDSAATNNDDANATPSGANNSQSGTGSPPPNTNNSANATPNSSDNTQNTANNASSSYYAQFGLRPRNGEILTVEELIRVRGMDADLLNKLEPLVTVYFSKSGTFDTETAAPLAAAVMADDTDDTSQGLENEAVQYSEHTAISATEDTSLTGRSFTISVDVQNPGGGSLTRSVVVEITGDPANPYWIRYLP